MCRFIVSVSYPAKVLTGEGKDGVPETGGEMVNIGKSCWTGILILTLILSLILILAQIISAQLTS